MFHRNSISFLFCFLAVGLFSIVGCESTVTSDTQVESDHDHDAHGHDHDHDFETLDEAVAEIEELSSEISEAFTSGQPESAHDALHHIDEVLEATESFIEESELSQDAKDSAASAIADLSDSFTALDEKMHGEEGQEFDDVKSLIESSIASLKATSKE